jgi:predicted nucleic acid-binding Zn ribbon protein
MNKHCPVCGAEIIAGQEVCLKCRVYLWEVVDGN